MKNHLKLLYRQVKSAHLRSLGYTVPERYQSNFVCWGGAAEAQYIYARLLRDVPPRAKVLIVGVMGGRDYFLLKNLAYDVTPLDLGVQPDIDGIVLANVEETLPFPPNFFDAVLLGEVLEHLKYDAQCLENLRRVLKADGRLLVTLPFYNDSEAGHMRIHSPESGKRLLRMGGFKVVGYLERPGIVWFRTVQNGFLHSVNGLVWLLTKKTVYAGMLSVVGKAEWALGKISWLRFIRRWAPEYGGYYLCKKDEALDYIALNRELYTESGKRDRTS